MDTRMIRWNKTLAATFNYSNRADGHGMDLPESAGSRGSAPDDEGSEGPGS